MKVNILGQAGDTARFPETALVCSCQSSAGARFTWLLILEGMHRYRVSPERLVPEAHATLLPSHEAPSS